MTGVRERLLETNRRLQAHYDIDRWHWQETTTATETCLGSILVQHTSWTNVEKALVRLRDAGAATFEVLDTLSEEAIADLVRPSGTPPVKARRLKVFSASFPRSYASVAASMGSSPSRQRSSASYSWRRTASARRRQT